MQTHITTTPFGKRALTLAQIANQVTAKAIPAGAAVNKWDAFRHIREAKDLLGATDRSLAILNALLSFHRDTELTASGTLVVWPSNEQLSARANGMPASTLRRHLAVLVECGLVVRRDSPNGKRFARKGTGGVVEQAYGFDLAPIVARAKEFEAMADAIRAEKKAFRVAKERLTLLRRDIVKMIEAGLEEGVPANWARVQQTYQLIVLRLPRTAPRQIVERVCADLQDLSDEIREVLESFVKSQNPSGNESHSGRHIQNSKTDSNYESNRTENRKEASGSAPDPDNVRSLPQRELPLGIVLDACPNLREMAQGGEIRHWRDLLSAAELARPMLSISPSAWGDACEVMGARHAAIALGAIYQRSDQINNAGGYLRSLTEKARAGKFSTWPMIMALLRAKLDADKSVEKADHEPSSGSGEGRLEVSEALLRSLSKPRSS
ncbi:plasmid replication protein RepC [Mesorhizobium sp. CAU 1741]|uniref:plasmid replication protein RepC n=1 Tax=Mesorhizobium sp. CAU 1741 TaxID=3140366 RepID=UPI00325B5CC0